MNPSVELIQGYLDGSLSEAQEAALTAWLKQDPAHLRDFTEALRFENDLRLAAEAEFRPGALGVFHPTAEPRPRRRSPWWRYAAAITLLAGLPWLYLQISRPREVVSVKEISGSLAWTGANGETRQFFASGDRLPPGMFETIGEGSRVTLAFRDGTRMDLRGDSRAVIAARRQKSIHLQSGSLRAQVSPQPAGKPLLVHTPTARLEVLGTVFSLFTVPRSTTMNVKQGRVKMERLADGGVVEVPAQHTAAASLETATPLAATRSVEAPTAWRWDATMPPPEEALRNWRPEEGFVSSLPIVVGSEPESGKRLIQHGIRFDSAIPLVHATRESVLRFRYRSARPAQIVVFLSTNFIDGSFGGNFEAVLPPGSGDPQDDGWRDVTLPFHDIPSIKPQYPLQPDGNEVNHLSLRSYHQDARLEFSRISIEPR